MLTLLATIFVFGLLVFVHELGHFVVAKMSGMKVTEFALGFGPSIFKKQEGETLYALRIIPLGGYNKIAGMDPDDPEDPRNFNNQSILKRLLVIIAGSTMNLLLPVILFFIVISVSGLQKPIDAPILGQIIEGKPAAIAGLKQDDVILQIEGRSVATWTEIVENIKDRASTPTNLLIKRQEQEMNIVVIPEYNEQNQRGVIGVAAKMEVTRPGVIETLKISVVQTYTIAFEMLKALYMLVFDTNQKADLAGPLGVAQMAGQVAQHGIIPLLQFAAFLSINLGLINLFPVPMLDGGHVVTLIIESIRGKALSPELTQKVQIVGMVLLFSLMIFATMKDIGRLF